MCGIVFDCGGSRRVFGWFKYDYHRFITRVIWCVSSHICASSQVRQKVGSSAGLADVDALLPRGTVCYYYLIRLKRFSTAFDAFLSHLPFRGGGRHFSEIKTFMSAASKIFIAAPRIRIKIIVKLNYFFLYRRSYQSFSPGPPFFLTWIKYTVSKRKCHFLRCPFVPELGPTWVYWKCPLLSLVKVY